MRLVFDTNVLVSALLTPGGVSRRAVDAALAVPAVVLYDARILAEYADVLARSKFAGVFPPDAAVTLVTALLAHSEAVEARPLAVPLRDPKDAPFAEVAIAGRADALVTGNARHFEVVRSLRLLTPRALLTRMKRT